MSPDARGITGFYCICWMKSEFEGMPHNRAYWIIICQVGCGEGKTR
jgi:hypothetical protein